MQLIDIGANLTHKSFDRDRDQVISRALAAGVDRMIVTGSSVLCSRQAGEIAQQYPGVLYSTVGIHPHYAAESQHTDRAELARLLQLKDVVAAGECGLDYFRNFSPKEDQRRVFAMQLELAAEYEKPVFLHQRDAHDDFVAILKDYLPGIPRAVSHCFTGDGNELGACLELDLHIGITGWICDERRGHHLREIVADIPLNRLMVETDAPYLLPRDLDPKPDSRRNEPMHLPHIVESIAKARGIEPLELASATVATSEQFFALP
ncbi:MAG: TatD family hydrolase [Gammaproteobacteria bacterium]|nr:TatD family hydrolase [Gammaproteobacteria bacterium]